MIFPLKLLGLALSSSILSSVAQARVSLHVNKIQCEGYVSFQSGTLQGRIQIVLSRNPQGEWQLNQLPAGYDLSKDPGRLHLDNLNPDLCDGVLVDYDVRAKVLRFHYTYVSSLQNGVCQKAAGRFQNCSEEISL